MNNAIIGFYVPISHTVTDTRHREHMSVLACRFKAIFHHINTYLPHFFSITGISLTQSLMGFAYNFCRRRGRSVNANALITYPCT